MPYYYRPKKKTAKTDTSELEKNPRVKVKKKVNLVDKLDKVFSKYIRLRDCMVGGYTRCISCGRVLPFEDMDCGHYHSRIHMSTRYDEDNCNSECKHCNRFSADHLIGYRENLLRKIGDQRMTLLEVKAHQCHKYADFELKAMIDDYTKKVKELSKAKSVNVR